MRARLLEGASCRLIDLAGRGRRRSRSPAGTKAGLDQIAQAAGCCNRKGRRSPKESIVIVLSLDAIRDHFGRAQRQTRNSFLPSPKGTVTEQTTHIAPWRRIPPDRFRSIAVIVPDEAAKSALAKLAGPERPRRPSSAQTQPYMVQIHPKGRNCLLANVRCAQDKRALPRQHWPSL